MKTFFGSLLLLSSFSAFSDDAFLCNDEREPTYSVTVNFSKGSIVVKNHTKIVFRENFSSETFCAQDGFGSMVCARWITPEGSSSRSGHVTTATDPMTDENVNYYNIVMNDRNFRGQCSRIY